MQTHISPHAHTSARAHTRTRTHPQAHNHICSYRLTYLGLPVLQSKPMPTSKALPRSISGSSSRSISKSISRSQVPGDVCEGGWQPTPVDVPCPSTGVQAGALKSLLLAGLAAGVLYLGYGFFCAGGGGGPKHSFEFAAPKGAAWGASGGRLVPDIGQRVQGRRSSGPLSNLARRGRSISGELW